MAGSAVLRRLLPAALALIVAGGYAGLRLVEGEMDPAALAEVGTRFSEGDPEGTEGYDGQFALFMAMDLDPSTVATRLDVPAYRYQRILLPLLARLLALGQRTWIPWTLLMLNWAAHGLGTYLLATWLERRGLSGWFAVIYGLWVGLVAAVGLDLHESLAFCLIVLGWTLWDQNQPVLGALAVGAALFAKETAVLFWAALLVAEIIGRCRRPALLALLGGGSAFAIWQLWLWRTFGALGLASGGAMATDFEWIPFMGLWRIASVDVRVLGLYLVIFGPSIVVPTVLALFRAAGHIRLRLDNAEAWALGLNALAILFLPFSTFREPLGLVRFATGLVLGVILLCGREGTPRPLRLGYFWVAMLAILLNR